MNKKSIAQLLEEKAEFYNRPGFIDTDPIAIPHRFTRKEDIEISGFLTATIAWGNRKSIIRSASKLMTLMDNAPFDFIQHFQPADLKHLESFVHRTFQFADLQFFLYSLQNIYLHHGGLENVFSRYPDNMQLAIENFRQIFLQTEHLSRSEKHISSPLKNSASKRINMFLRWMVRNDRKGVDFGIWKSVSPAALKLPLDVHTGNVARKLGILTRKQNDWKAVEEVTGNLKKLKPEDPVLYDFALFGMGVFEKW